MQNRYVTILTVWVLSILAGVVPAQAVSKLDGSFGLNGRVAVELGVKNSGHAVLVQPDGRIVVAGASSTGAALNFSLLRFNKDGTLDTSFNGEGVKTASIAKGDDEVLALGLLSDGRIVVGGYSHNGTDRDFALACLQVDGTLDSGFGTNGVVVTPVGSGNEEITALRIGRDDMITVAGAVEGTTGRVLATARYFPDGVLDSGYGEQGVSLIAVGTDAAAEGIIGRADGTLVLSGSYTDGKTASLMLVGLTADGALDVGFGEQGVAVPAGTLAASEGYRLAEDRRGRIYLAGSVGLAGKRDTALFRFTASGKADDSFGKGGVIITAVSREDDVLYDVVVAKRGVVASGYSTDGGTRQFLLATFRDNGSEPLIETTAATDDETAAQNASSSATEAVQEITRNGGTKVQIRKLKIATSRTDSTSARHAPSTARPLPMVADAAGPGYLAELGRLAAAAIERFESLLVTPAVAADSGSATASTETEAAAGTVKFVTTTFSTGESVSYALTTDAAGNVIAVGTADGTEASSIVAARYVADATTSTTEAGYTNGNIITRTPTDVTRSTVITGGEVRPALGKTVTKRGVVYSTTDTPVYTGSSDSTDDDPDDDTDDGTDSTTGPVISNHTDASFSSTSGTLKVKTDVAATCHYNSNSDVEYANMEWSLSPSVDGLTHEASLTGLTPDTTYNYYVRCMANDGGGTNEVGTLVAFKVSSSATSFLPSKTFEVLASLLEPAYAIAATTDTDTTTDSTTTTTGIFGVTASSDSSDEDFVKEGETENGSGYGNFSAKLEKLKPGTVYYVRAYALTADGVYYGPQMQFRTADACFVATASYGSLLHPGVRILRQFRDAMLTNSAIGGGLVELYYTLSPPVADIIAANSLLRHLVQLLLLPLIGFSWLALQLGLAKALLVATGAAVSFGWGATRLRARC